MPIDARLQRILDEAKALGHPPQHEQTPELARFHRREMMARFAPYRSLATYHVWASLKDAVLDAD